MFFLIKFRLLQDIKFYNGINGSLAKNLKTYFIQSIPYILDLSFPMKCTSGILKEQGLVHAGIDTSNKHLQFSYSILIYFPYQS